MTNIEIVENLKQICFNKLENSKKAQDKEKIKLFEAILNVLKMPDCLSKTNIEVTMNILNDLEIDDETTFLILNEIMDVDDNSEKM